MEQIPALKARHSRAHGEGREATGTLGLEEREEPCKGDTGFDMGEKIPCRPYRAGSGPPLFLGLPPQALLHRAFSA
jgi:hypothetical protein